MVNFSVNKDRRWEGANFYTDLEVLGPLSLNTLEGVIRKDPIIGNNTTLRSSGSTALFTFLNTNNKQIINVNLGDGLSILKI